MSDKKINLIENRHGIYFAFKRPLPTSNSFGTVENFKRRTETVFNWNFHSYEGQSNCIQRPSKVHTDRGNLLIL